MPFGKFRHIKTQDLVAWYIDGHFTLRQIAKLSGISPPAVHKRLARAGITREQGTWVTVKCDMCGKDFRKHRAYWRRSIEHYCNRECQAASMESPGYKPWRQGQRLARAIVAQYRRLEPGEIVHHKDGDDRNNDRSNLAVYASNSDHIKAHHGKSRVEPIWDGASVVYNRAKS